MQITICYGNQNLGSYDLEQFHKEVVSFGRQPDNDIVLNYDFVSRVHGVFYKENGIWNVQDLNSNNGVQFEGRKIAGTRQIHTGDRFVITTGKTNQYIVLTVEQNHRTTQTANIVFKKPEKKMISVRELVEWIIASILVLFIAVSSIIGAGIPAYLNHKFANEKLSGCLIGTTFQIEDEYGHEIEYTITDTSQIISIETSEPNWIGFFRYEYYGAVNVDIGTGILENISVDVTVPFMGWKKEVAWYFNMDTVPEYGNEREVSDVGFDFVQAPYVTVGDIMSNLGIMGSYEIMAVGETCVSQSYDAIEFAVIYREKGINFSEPREDWTRIEYNYETGEWEWCPPIEKGNKSSFGMVFAEMNFEDGIFEPDEEYTSDYEIGISLNFASIMEE